MNISSKNARRPHSSVVAGLAAWLRMNNCFELDINYRRHGDEQDLIELLQAQGPSNALRTVRRCERQS
jgi:hypothetical protein